MSITMNITDRIESINPETTPEDLFSSSLSVIFPDAVANQHGDVHNALVYSSPRLPRSLRIDLSDPPSEEDRLLFGHYLWNASLLAAELVEGGTLGVARGSDDEGGESRDGRAKKLGLPLSAFDIKGKSIVELGAGTALPSTMAALLGAKEVCVTDYPSPALMDTLKANVARNVAPENAPSGTVCPKLEVTGHSWGDFEGLEGKKHAYDIVVAADCLVRSQVPKRSPSHSTPSSPPLAPLNPLPSFFSNFLPSAHLNITV